jgi:DNA-binding Lrp family transcriptional regulator
VIFVAILAYVLFKVSSGTEGEVAQKLIELDEVLYADTVFGEYDVIARVAVEDLESLEQFVSNRIRSIENILVTSTMIISKSTRASAAGPKSRVFGFFAARLHNWRACPWSSLTFSVF